MVDAAVLYPLEGTLPKVPDAEHGGTSGIAVNQDEVDPADLRNHSTNAGNRYRRNFKEEIVPNTESHARVRIITNGEVDYKSEDKFSSVRWVDIESPNEKVLASVGAKLGISEGTLKLCLNGGITPQSFSRADALYLSFPEFSVSPDNGYRVEVNLVHAIIGNGSLLTIHKKPSQAISRVAGELRQNEISDGDRHYSNHLLGRIVGSSLHHNMDLLSQLDSRRDRILSNGVASLTPDKLKKISVLEHSLQLMQGTLANMAPVVTALGEPENLFGAPTPKGALARYRGIVTAIMQSIELDRSIITSSRENWELENESKASRSSFRLAFLGGLLGPPGIFTGIVEAAAASGVIFSPTIFWVGLAASTAISGALIYHLVKDYFSRPGNKGRN